MPSGCAPLAQVRQRCKAGQQDRTALEALALPFWLPRHAGRGSKWQQAERVAESSQPPARGDVLRCASQSNGEVPC